MTGPEVIGLAYKGIAILYEIVKKLRDTAANLGLGLTNLSLSNLSCIQNGSSKGVITMPPGHMSAGIESMATMEGCMKEPHFGVDGVFIWSLTDKCEEKKYTAICVVIPGITSRKDNQLVTATAIYNGGRKEEEVDCLENKEFLDFLNNESEEVVIDEWVWSKTKVSAKKANIRMLHHRSTVIDIYGNPSAAHSHGIWLITFKDCNRFLRL